MRQAGTINSQQDAQRFVDYLLTLGIQSKLDRAAEGWALWILDENQVSRSREELDRFQLAPQDNRYRDAEHAARTARREADEKNRQAQRRYVDLRGEWESPWRRRPVTLVMIVVSVALALHLIPMSDEELVFSWPLALEGELWRLVTPIFLHADLSTNPLHLILNMIWLYDLGTLIERRLGSLRYIALILLIAIASNVGQYVHAGPNFVGMSGVVYGLLGYAWIRGRLEPSSGMFLHGQVVVFMMAWLVACMLIDQLHAANGAHVVGLAAGCVLGYLSHVVGRLARK